MYPIIVFCLIFALHRHPYQTEILPYYNIEEEYIMNDSNKIFHSNIMSDEFDHEPPIASISGGGGGGKHPPSFFTHVFQFDGKTKNELSNIIQYAVLAIIPIIVVNKGIARIIPDFDETKDSYIIALEVVSQLILTLLGMFFTHRVITYIPTYSNIQYPSDVSIIYIVLVLLTILLGMQTNMGNKVNVLSIRFMEAVDEMINGKKVQQQQQHAPPMYISQPIVGTHQPYPPPPPQYAEPPSYAHHQQPQQSTYIDSLPNDMVYNTTEEPTDELEPFSFH